MMKKLILVIVIIFAVQFAGCNKKGMNAVDSVDKNNFYKDGTYQGKTQIDYEGYITEATITVENSRITTIDWNIYNDVQKLPFDKDYEKVFDGNPVYQRQCRKDLAGMKKYGPRLIKTQDINEVDAVSGATWSYKKFKKVVNNTLRDAYPESAEVD